ncbi:MAG TPA: alpha/beta fold hydrolase [Janthinobacterium sp.]|jgi:homoserine O-acetyltransferase|nr:alpha/beta fold hydrolase [Janthinobacterium sp.]
MTFTKLIGLAVFTMQLTLSAGAAPAADYPAPQEGTWVARNADFRSGEVLPELRIHYLTIGAPTGEPVLILHGTTGSAASLLTPQFAGQLFGPGQALDARRYYIIIPDGIGGGGSSKPSDGLRARFPKYDYDDMVKAQYRLLTEHLAVKHLRLVLGYSMGGMHTWLWAEKYPDFMDVAVPMASLPTEVAGRNWMLRRLIIDSVRNDPEWMNGNYVTQPRAFQIASVFYGLAANGGSQALYAAAPTREKADRLVDLRLKAPFTGDANDHLYQWDASRTYNASPDLEKIQATLLAINATDDERNPPELGVLESEIKRVRHGAMLLVPGSAQTAGHGTLTMAKLWAPNLAALLQSAPKNGK